jgi:8-oxo-dGTP pyrophosphatase MutT (NUDIX family)
MTLGVRAVVIDPGGKVFLIKHTYVTGWHLPGGGVEPGETALDALTRELMEEGSIVPTGMPEFVGLYFNANVSDRDHVALYLVREFRQDKAPVPDHEIMAHGFFSPDEMPGDTTAATRARIAEVLLGTPRSQRW